MEKAELASILTEILAPIGFKRKGNFWVINGPEITKMVNLQKYQYSNSYYINYGYILKSIPIEGLMMHIGYRLTSKNAFERDQITSLLNLDNDISNLERIKELNLAILNNLVSNMQSINTEQDILKDLKLRTNLND